MNHTRTTRTLPAALAAAALAIPPLAGAPPRDYPVRTVPPTDAAITGGFWRQRLDVHFTRGLDHALDQCRKTGRIDNFELAAGRKQGEHQGACFNDSDVYKILEGLAWSTAGPLKPEHRRFIDEFTALLADAQMDDGYLYTFYQVKNELQNRWTNVAHMHELYCAGHLFEAGAAHHRMTGRRELLDVCLKLADHIDKTFGPGRKGDPPGHSEIELALAELHRITGEPRYLELARFFLEQRGVRPGNWYHQEHVRLLDGSEAVGHAVRAVYAFCGMAEIAALTGDERYHRALDRYWQSVTNTKMAVTGGVGGGLWEAFDMPYFLPNRSAYNETCGSIAQVFWNHRMFRLTGDAKFLDVLERALYNGVLSGVQLSGDAFFYPNQLVAHPQVRDNTGRVAIERGPLVYCLEGPDNAMLDTPFNVLLPADARFTAEFQPGLLGGVTVLTTAAEMVKRGADGVAVEREPRTVTAVPYFARANREPAHMAVFLLRDPAAAILPPVPSLATMAKVSSSTGKGDFGALRDQVTPARSGDHSRGVFVWHDRLGTTEWVQYEFPEPQTISSSGVYWYDRFGTAERLPMAWRLLYRDGGEWRPVDAKDPFGLATDTVNKVRFTPVKTDALRLEADLQDNFLDPYLAIPDSQPGKFTAAILEWSVQ